MELDGQLPRGGAAGGRMLICRIGVRRCGTMGRWWAVAAAAIVGGRAATGEASCCGGGATVENCGVVSTLVLSVYLSLFTSLSGTPMRAVHWPNVFFWEKKI